MYSLNKGMLFMPDLIGFTDTLESAGRFTDKELKEKTGVYNRKSGDYQEYALIDYYSGELVNADTLNFGITKQESIEELIDTINRFKKIRQQPQEAHFIKGNASCPYCKEELTGNEKAYKEFRVCKCGKIYTEGKLWKELKDKGYLMY